MLLSQCSVNYRGNGETKAYAGALRDANEVIEALSTDQTVETWKHVGNGVSSENSGLREGFGDAFGDERVGEKHELLDEAVGVFELIAVHRERIVRFAVHLESHLRRGQRQRARADSLRLQLLREIEEQMDAVSDLRTIVVRVQIVLRLLVAWVKREQRRNVSAPRERMIVFLNCVRTTSAFGVSSAITENAKRS